MHILERACPECKGHVILDVDTGTLTCEDCGKAEKSRNKKDILLAMDKTVEYGPKSKRRKPTSLGNLFLHPHDGLAAYLRQTLEDAVRGFELADYDLEQLKKFGFVEVDNNDQK